MKKTSMKSERQMKHILISALVMVLIAEGCKQDREQNAKAFSPWSIGIYTGASPFDLKSSEGIKNPVLTAADVSDVPATFIADPFMVRKGTSWYMFFEVLNAANNQGDIGFAESSDGFHWHYGKIVLDEDFHLSYPYIFKYENDYYMIPESNEVKAVRLYRAVEFPTKWRFESRLLKGERFSDNSVFYDNRRWWLFTETSSKPHNNGTLRLYYASHLKGTWTEHPESPVVENDPNIARPGGRVIKFGNEIIRYAQDDYPYYGNQVWAMKITELTTIHYREKLYRRVVKAGESGWNRLGMHTVDPHQISPNQWIACVDGKGEIK